MMIWAGHIALMVDMRNAYKISVGKHEGKKLIGRPRRRWEDNIRMELARNSVGNRGLDSSCSG
jgi:hypothetical protein